MISMLPINPDQLLSAYNYYLPEELIAQNPAQPRDSSRLLVVEATLRQQHQRFSDLPHWLRAGDLLVLNNTKVLKSRLIGKKVTGAPVEILLLEPQALHSWLCLVKPGKRFKVGAQLCFYPPSDRAMQGERVLKAKVMSRDLDTGGRVIRFDLPLSADFTLLLEEFGTIPLPPYITDSQALVSQYQTVYAAQPGAVAAPTAGLHFTEDLLAKLEAQGVNIAHITLHVGVGTFRPVEVETITQHQMHQEWLDLPPETVTKILATKAQGGRVFAVGTTVVRCLEGAMQELAKQGQSELQAFQGKTDLFIYPGYQWQLVDGLITNFHLPRSSLLMLVSAFVGRDRLLELYNLAIANGYRFYSFGDAMLILPEAKV
jgi:S-adenosylmethionine:tRNA ribosyltransferase-isomerase